MHQNTQSPIPTHESSHLHVTGKALYIDDINLPANALIGVALYSPVAKGTIKKLDYSDALKMPGIKTIMDFSHIPGHNQMGAVIKDEPALAEKQVEFIRASYLHCGSRNP